jgi:drug/metabolite transporter (DMT)-like permease
MKKAFLQLHAAIFLAGFTGVLGKLISINESLLVWYRMFFSAIILFLISLFTNKIRRLEFLQSIQLIGIGAVVALHWVFFYGSIKYSNVSVGLVCLSAVGFFSAFLDPLFTKRRIDPVEVLLGIMVMLGIFLIFHFDRTYTTGILFGMVSSLLAALFPVLNKKLVGKYNAETITFYEIGGGWLLLNLFVPIYLWFIPTKDLVPGWTDFFWLMVLSLLCTVFAFNLSVRSLTRISPFTVNLSFNLEPVYGMLLAFILFKEHTLLGTSFYAGMGIIFSTVIFQSIRVYQKGKGLIKS